MHKIKKAEKSDFEIDKNKKEIKNDYNPKSPQEKKDQFLSQKDTNKNRKLKLANRPHSNYLPKHKNNINTKTSKINNLVAIGYSNNPLELNNQKLNQKFYVIEKEINTNETIINKNSNEINLIKEFNSQNEINTKEQKQNMEYNKILDFFTCPIKRNKRKLIEVKSAKNKHIYNNQINRYLTPKYSVFQKNKKIISTEKTTSIRCASPSTANNTISNKNNSNSTNYFFCNSVIANNITNNLIKHIKGNEKNIDGNILMPDNSGGNKNMKMTAIEYQLNQILAKKEKQLKGKNSYLSPKHESFNFEELYSNYTKKLEESSIKDSLINYTYADIKKEYNNNEITSINRVLANLNYNYYKSTIADTHINAKHNYFNTSLNLFSTKYKNRNNNKINNPIIKYSFFNKIMNNITRKVNFVNPNTKKELELSIRANNGEIFSKSKNNCNNNNDFISYGYELTPQNILKMKEINNKGVQKTKENKKNNNTQKMKKERRSISSFILSQKNNYLNYKKIPDPYKYNKIEESKNKSKVGEKLNIINGIENYNDKTFDLLDLNSASNNTPHYIDSSLNIECLGESAFRNKLNWNLISRADKKKGRILWKKISKVKKTKKINKKYHFYNKNRKDQSKIGYKYIDFSQRTGSGEYTDLEKNRNYYSINRFNDNNDEDFGSKAKLYFNNKSNIINREEQKRLLSAKIGKNNLNKKKQLNNNDIYSKILNYSKISEDEIEKGTNDQENEEEKLDKNKENENEKNDEDQKNNYQNQSKLNDKYIKNNNINQNLKKNKKIDKNIIAKHNYNYNKEKNKINHPLGVGNQIHNSITTIEMKPQDNTEIIKTKKENKSIDYNDFIINITWDDIFLNFSKIFSKSNQSLNTENNSNNIINDLNTSISNEERVYNLSYEYDDDKIIDTFQQKIIEIEYERNNKPEVIFKKMAKKYQVEYKEDEKLNQYYEDLFNKFGKESDKKELVDITFFGINLKITKKIQAIFYRKFMNYIKEENRKKRNQANMILRLNELLNKYVKTKKDGKINNKFYKKCKSQLIRKDKNLLFLKSKKVKDTPSPKKIVGKKDNNEYQNNFLWGVKVNSMKEVEKKKEEILLRLKDDTKHKIKEGIISKSEMDNFLIFQKKINELQLNEINNRIYLKKLEQSIIAFEEELKINEEKKKNERRINNFIDSMNFDLLRGYEIKKFLEKTFSHAIDLKKINYLNILSPVRKNAIQ